MEIEWNEIRARTIMDRWDFSWDVTQGLIKKSMVAVIPVDKPEDSAAERGKAVKLAKRRCISASDITYFRDFATPLCLSASCYPSLSLQAIVPTERIVSE